MSQTRLDERCGEKRTPGEDMEQLELFIFRIHLPNQRCDLRAGHRFSLTGNAHRGAYWSVLGVTGGMVLLMINFVCQRARRVEFVGHLGINSMSWLSPPRVQPRKVLPGHPWLGCVSKHAHTEQRFAFLKRAQQHQDEKEAATQLPPAR